jgi:hypothetical protein
VFSGERCVHINAEELPKFLGFLFGITPVAGQPPASFAIPDFANVSGAPAPVLYQPP